MDEIKRINNDNFKDIASKLKFNPTILTKDYFLTIVLYLIKNIQGLYFKGGTALQKIVLNHSRLSEDLDFTLTRNKKDIINEISSILTKSKLFTKITKDKDVDKFTRLIIHYKDFSNKDDSVFIDLNERSKLLLESKKYKIEHFYDENIPEFSFNCLSEEEMIAEKVAATIGRNRPRDYYDLYKIIKNNIKINLNLVKKKCKQSNVDFNIIKMFNNARKIKNRWDDDMIPLLVEEVSFYEVMKTLSSYFNLKEEKKLK